MNSHSGTYAPARDGYNFALEHFPAESWFTSVGFTE